MRILYQYFHRLINIHQYNWLIFIVLIFWVGVFRHVDLPGIYMDGVNPDYLAARVLSPELSNPAWTLPTKWIPFLGGIYHGMQNTYVGLPVFWLLGTTVVALRIAQSLFGAIIVGCIFLTVERLTRNRILAIIAGIGLATDIAFLASFRTQNYIILGGFAWLMLAILPIINSTASLPSSRRLIFSGLCAGLAVYGYFVLAFFLPAIITYILFIFNAKQRQKSLLIWLFGCSIGLLPYLIGYISMGIALGGVRELIVYLKQITAGLAPLSSDLSLVGALGHDLNMTRMALGNGGNESLIFGNYVNEGIWNSVKFWALICTTGLMGVFLVLPAKILQRTNRSTIFLMTMLPCSYLVFSSYFGNRLQSHHFSVLIPFVYFMPVLCWHYGKDVVKKIKYSIATKLERPLPILLLLILMTGNFTQQQVFFRELEASGGSGKTTNALTQLANDALNQPAGTLYIFPEWGFFMSFAFLTGNKVPYQTELTEFSIKSFHPPNQKINLAFWHLNDISKYQAELNVLGITKTELHIYYRRDGEPAFYMLSASL